MFVARFTEAWRTPLIGAAAVTAIAVLLARATQVPGWIAAAISGVALSVAVVWPCRVAMRSRAAAQREALARLDAALGLHDRLAAAAEGVVTWPPFPEPEPTVVRWRWRPLADAPLLAGGLIFAASCLPVSPPALPVVAPADRPPVFGELTEMLEELRQSETAAPSALDQLQQTLDELAARDPAGLYSHGTLEAASNLVDQTAAGAGELAAGLQAAEAALTQLADASDPAATKAAQDALNNALRALQNSGLAPSPALAGGLQHAAQGQLSPQQLASLSRNLRNASNRAEQRSGNATMSFRKRTGTPSSAAGRKSPGEGDAPGSGDISRGPGHPPLELASDPAERRDGVETPLESSDSDRASIGDLVSETAGAPRTDPRQTQSTGAGGTFASPDRGGEAARVDELTPAERRAVRRFFK